jgi:hypothetical protein
MSLLTYRRLAIQAEELLEVSRDDASDARSIDLFNIQQIFPPLWTDEAGSLSRTTDPIVL